MKSDNFEIKSNQPIYFRYLLLDLVLVPVRLVLRVTYLSLKQFNNYTKEREKSNFNRLRDKRNKRMMD